jgi:hypothetical protein
LKPHILCMEILTSNDNLLVLNRTNISSFQLTATISNIDFY